MDVNITPLTNFTSPNKSRQKFNRLIPSGYTPLTEKTQLTHTDFTLARKTAVNPPLLIITKSSKNNFESLNLNGNKGVLLYQQTERNKNFSNDSELINRFNLKV